MKLFGVDVYHRFTWDVKDQTQLPALCSWQKAVSSCLLVWAEEELSSHCH